MQERNRTGLALGVALVAHAALFAALARPASSRPEPAQAILVLLDAGDAVGLIHAAVRAPALLAPQPSPPEPSSPPAPAAEAPSPAPPTPSLTDAPPAENVVDLAARLIAAAPLLPASAVANPIAPSTPPPVAAASPIPAAGEAGCDITETLHAALQQNAAVQNALARTPREARSVANAIMLWDGRWVEAAVLGGPANADPIRSAIVDQVRLQSPACRDRPVRGPRFITLVAQPANIVLAVGSGEWRWADLLSADGAVTVR